MADAIAAVRADLRAAQDSAVRTDDPRFAVKEVEIEFAVEVGKTAGGEASVKVFSVLSIGGKGEVATKDVNRVKVVLNPIGVDSKPFEVASQQARRPDRIDPVPPQGRPGG